MQPETEAGKLYLV